MGETVSDNVVISGCQNTHVINELQIRVIALVINDCIVAAIPDGILVSDKEKSPELKSFVADRRAMYERREWGEYKVLDYKV